MDDQKPVRNLSFGTLFKIVFWAGACAWCLIGILMLLVALTMPSAITVNGTQAATTGQAIGAIPILLVVGLMVSALFAAAGSGIMRIVGRFLPPGNVEVERK